ncbi:hypothetical protein [Microbacterium sp.]|uniref:hypothetical protein n=1 Tax=Microbacterium sp. TaxID=51671 RepID=UPI0026204D2D|nr:hypothetical protein [Microbacterium sp.]
MPISDDIAHAFDLIPEAGEGVRWYDPPYRLIGWLLSGWRRKIIHRGARTWLNDRLNDLLQFNEHDRHKVYGLDSTFHNLFVPPEEHVRVGGIWVVELFPPTELPSLERAMKRNGWSKPRAVPPHEADNLATLERSRSGAGRNWWRLADVVDLDATSFYAFHAHKMKLPAGFAAVEVRAVQIGQGLTAALAHFVLTEDAATALDTVWHTRHEPMLVRQNGRFHPLDRHWAGLRQIQDARRALHTSARDWMTRRLPGSFAANGEPQVLLELLFLDDFDPLNAVFDESNEDEVRLARVRQSDAYRALGLDVDDFEMIKGKSLPGLVLSQPGRHRNDRLGEDPTWTLWGNMSTVSEGLASSRAVMGGSTEREASRQVDRFHDLLPLLAVSEYLSNADARYARLRDRASSRHGKFKARALRELRQSFLTLSLNITSMRRDVADFWRRRVPYVVSDFKIHEAPRYKVRSRSAGRRKRKPILLDQALKERLDNQFDRLTEADRDYRDILSTVASLGASADAFKIGRWALVVAIASLAVAGATVILADVGCGSILQELFGWPPPTTH